MYSSSGELHIELLSGQAEGAKSLWVCIATVCNIDIISLLWCWSARFFSQDCSSGFSLKGYIGLHVHVDGPVFKPSYIGREDSTPPTGST